MNEVGRASRRWLETFRALAVASAFVTVGCIDDFDRIGDGDDDDGPSCIALCNEAKDCPDYPEPDIDCFDACAEAEDMARNAGCMDELERYMDCFSRLDDICDTEGASVICEDELNDYADCLSL